MESEKETMAEEATPLEEENWAQRYQQEADARLRALADIENLRRRHEKEREESQKYAIMKFARDVLVIADNVQRALESMTTQEGSDAFVEGISLVQKDIESVFSRHGIEKVSSLHEPFDHNIHQAMLEIEATQDQKPGTIVQVLQDGYKIHDKLLRAAMVAVAKKKGDA